VEQDAVRRGSATPRQGALRSTPFLYPGIDASTFNKAEAGVEVSRRLILRFAAVEHCDITRIVPLQTTQTFQHKCARQSTTTVRSAASQRFDLADTVDRVEPQGAEGGDGSVCRNCDQVQVGAVGGSVHNRTIPGNGHPRGREGVAVRFDTGMHVIFAVHGADDVTGGNVRLGHVLTQIAHAERKEVFGAPVAALPEQIVAPGVVRITPDRYVWMRIINVETAQMFHPVEHCRFDGAVRRVHQQIHLMLTGPGKPDQRALMVEPEADARRQAWVSSSVQRHQSRLPT
jgi:hypothetical protein